MSYKKSTLDTNLKNMGKRWSKDEDEKILKALAKGGKGATLEALSKVLFRTENSVRYRIYGKAYGDYRLGIPVNEILAKYRLDAEEFDTQRERIEEQERMEVAKAQEILSGKNLAERSIKLGKYDNVQHFKAHLSTESDPECDNSGEDLGEDLGEDMGEEEDGSRKSNEVDDSEDDRELIYKKRSNRDYDILGQVVSRSTRSIRSQEVVQKLIIMITETKQEMNERVERIEEALNTITQHLNKVTTTIHRMQKMSEK